MNEVIKNISEWEIETPSGWSNFSGIKRITKNKVCTIVSSTGKRLTGSLNHKIKLENDTFVYLSDIQLGDTLLSGEVIVDKFYTDGDVKLYDLLDVEKNNEYYTNDIVSHNCAFIQKIDEIWAAAQQTLATGGGAIVLSTPNGTGNFFHRTWVDAESGGQFHPIRLHWSLHPERDESWRQLQTELLGERLAAQECDTDFISSGHTVVAGELIEWYRETYTQEPIEKRGMGGELWIWEYPDYTKDYIVAADVARGDGGDYSAFHIIELKSLRQVAEFRGKIGTTEYGHMLVSMATEYNNAILAIENANIGWAVIQVAIDKGYPNLYYSYRQDGYLDENIHLSKGYDLKDKSAMVPGFTTSSKTRPLMIAKLETYFREKAPIIHSKRLIDELLVFIWIGNRAEAQHGYNDDLIMSLCIALWIRDTALKLKQQGLDLTLKAVTHIGKHSGIYTVNDPSNSPWTNRLPDGSSESLKWLL